MEDDNVHRLSLKINSKIRKYIYTIIYIAIIISIYIQLYAYLCNSTWEDVFIGFRYARNWVEGKGLVFNTGEYVEGYSTQLWVLLCCLFYLVGFTSRIGIIIAVFICISIMLGFLFRLYPNKNSRGIILIILLSLMLNTLFNSSFANGLEGPATAMALVILIYGVQNYRVLFVLLGSSLLVFNRFEGIVYIPVVICWLFYSYYKSKISLQKILIYMIIMLYVFVVLVLFRCLYYGDILPNTVHAKSQPFTLKHFSLLWDGTQYLVNYCIIMGLPLFVLAFCSILFSYRRDLFVLIISFILINMCIIWIAGGDWSYDYRLLTPFYILILYAAIHSVIYIYTYNKYLGLSSFSAYILSIIFTFQPYQLVENLNKIWKEPFPYSILRSFEDKCTNQISPNIQNTDFQLAEDKVVIELGGIQSWLLWDVHVIEMMGLTDRELATRRGPYVVYNPGGGIFNIAEIIKKHPTYFTYNYYLSPYHVLGFYDNKKYIYVPEFIEYFRNFLHVRNANINNNFNNFYVKSDRELLGALLLDYAEIIPLSDYPMSAGSQSLFEFLEQYNITDLHDMNKYITKWHQQPWISDLHSPIHDEWILWYKDREKLSARLPYGESSSCYTKDLVDNNSLVLIFASTSVKPVHIKCRIYRGEEVFWSESRQVPGITKPGNQQWASVFIPSEHIISPARLSLDLQGDYVGTLSTAAFRWSGKIFPPFPDILEISEDTWGGGMSLLFVELAKQNERNGNLEGRDFFIDKAVEWPSISENVSKFCVDFLIKCAQFDKANMLLLRAATAYPKSINNYISLLQIQSIDKQDNYFIKTFKKLLDSNANQFIPNLFYTFALDKTGSIKEAQSQWSTTLSLLPKQLSNNEFYNTYIEKIGEISTQYGLESYAKDLYRWALHDEKVGGQSAISLSNLYLQNKDWSGLVEEWNRLSHSMPKNTTVMDVFKNAIQTASFEFSMQGKLAEEEGRYQDALTAYLQGSSIDSQNMDIRVQLARLQALTGDMLSAIEGYKHVLITNPESPSASIAAVNLEDLAEAGKTDINLHSFWSSLVKRHPNSVLPRLYLGSILEKRSEWNNARKVYMEACAIDPDNLVPVCRVALLDLRLGDDNKGGSVLKEVTAQDSSLAVTVATEVNEIAGEFAAKGHLSKAISLLKLLLDISHDDLWAKLHLGELQESAGEVDAAVKTYEDVVRLNPEADAALLAAEKLTKLLQNNGRSDYLYVLWEDIVKTYPQARLPRLYLGTILEGNGEWQRARRIYEEGLVSNPKDLVLYYHIAIVDIVCGDKDSGINVIRDTIDKDNSLVQEIAQALAETAKSETVSNDNITAEIVYKLRYEILPNDPYVIIDLAEKQESAGNLFDAIENYKKILYEGLESSAAEIAANKLENLFKKEDNNEAYTFWNLMVERNPNSILPRLYLGSTLERQGELESARKVYVDARSLDPDNPVLSYRLALLDLLLGNRDTKDCALKEAINKVPALACTAASKIAEIAGERASQGKISDAIDLYKLVLDISPNDLWARVHLGEQQEIAGETSAAIITYEEVLCKDPESPEAQIASVKLVELLKKNESAVSACSVLEDLVKVYPHVRILRLYLGAVLETKNEYEQARKIYEEGLKLYPEDLVLRCRIAVLEIISDKTDEGLKIINSAIKKDPSIVSDVARSITETAQTMVASGNMTIAQTLYKLAYEISPNDLWALVHLGELYTISGESDTAIRTFQEVLLKAPESPVTAAKLHALLKENNDYAFDCWSSLVSAHPTASVPRQYLGMVYEDRGDFKQASAQYKIILKNNPDFTEAIERLEIIKNAYSGPN